MGLEVKTFFKKRRKLGRSFPTGTVFFTGSQGAGKSLSASHYLKRLKDKYPDLYIYSNIKLKIADKIITSEEVADYVLDRRIEGDECGVCSVCVAKTDPDYFDTGDLCIKQKEIPIAFFLDEIQTVLFGSKKAVSFEVFKAICQQRKALKTVIGTMQEFLDLDISYRRQLQAQVECLHVGPVQIEMWKDPQTLHFDQKQNDYIGRTFRLNIWKRHNEAYDIYNTLEIVDATMQMDTAKKQAHLKSQPTIIGAAPT
jgi:hypothetical protein